MIVYDSLSIFPQVAAYMIFPVQIFKWTHANNGMSWSAPSPRHPFEPRASMDAKRPNPSRKLPRSSRNQSNTVQNESLREGICLDRTFVLRLKSSCHEFGTPSFSDFFRRNTLKWYTEHYTRPSKIHTIASLNAQ